MPLHPQAVTALELWSTERRVTEPGFGQAGIDAKRAEARAEAAAEPRERVDRVADVDADGVRCRLYVPAGAPPTPLRTLLFLHGGGFVFGDLHTHDAQSRRLANRTRSAVLAVDYRKPPEHRFPAAPDDVDTALAWLLARGSGLGLDTGRLVAAGDSAGGNLALVATLRNPNAFAACVLVYPFVDPTTSLPSYAATDGGLTRGEAQWYWNHYARTPKDLTDPDLAPHLSTALGSLPPTLVQIAGCDVLADEDRELARRMAEAGAPVESRTYDGMVHRFWRHPELFDAAEQALVDAARFLDRVV